MMEPLNPKWVMWVWIATGFTLLAYIPYNPIEHPVYNLLVSTYIFFVIFYTVQYGVEGGVSRMHLDDYYDDWGDAS